MSYRHRPKRKIRAVCSHIAAVCSRCVMLLARVFPSAISRAMLNSVFSTEFLSHVYACLCFRVIELVSTELRFSLPWNRASKKIFISF